MRLGEVLCEKNQRLLVTVRDSRPTIKLFEWVFPVTSGGTGREAVSRRCGTESVESPAPVRVISLSLFSQPETLIQGGCPMAGQDSNGSSQAVVLAFLGGAVAGVLGGLLLAPKSGEESRRMVKGYARRAEEEALAKAREGRVALDEAIECGTHFLAEKAAKVEAAVKARRGAVKGVKTGAEACTP